jgi:hypothetical protein
MKSPLRIESLEARIPPAAVLNLSALDGRNGFKITGAAAYDRAGRSVSDAGDVNGAPVIEKAGLI